MLFPTAFLLVLEKIFWVVFLYVTMGGTALLGAAGATERFTWLAGDFLAVGFFALAPTLYAGLVWRNFHLFSWALLAMISALWSLTPGLSAYHGAQLLMTLLVGLVLLRRFGLEGVARLLFVALTLGVLLSLLAAGAGVPNSRMLFGEWQGMYSHKNTLGTACVMLIYTSAALAWAGWRPIICLLVIALALPVLAMTWSGGAFVSLLAVAGAAPFLVAWSRGLRAALVAVALGLSAGAAVVFAIASRGINPMTLLLESLGKDTTLTGRTLLWDFGLTAFSENPLIGLGYKAYWEAAETTKAYLRFWMEQDLWTFHNNTIEVAVAFGIVGLVVFFLGILIAVASAVRRFFEGRRPMDAWGLMVMVHVLVISLAENPLFYNHSILQVLFVVAGSRIATSRASYPSARDYGMVPAR